uniref:Ionotropic glutamate receptor C-terminal domain-containing protein n=1 Tax=Eptatretus burgeri TaxID=7764 RepID=A0A8C4QQ59_EPTBU
MTNDSIRLWEIEESLVNNTAEFALFGYPYTLSKTKLELSEPVFENGYHIIMSGKEIPQTRLFQFLEPLNTLLWVSMLSVCSGVGIVLAIIARLHPDEWYHLAQRNIVSKEDGERFSLVNSLWFAFSSMVGQCGDRLPLSMAGKIIAYAWWFFVLVACSTYTANLAAFFTASGSVNIQSLKDLARRTDIRYGTYSGYHLVNLLQSSSRDPYSTVWRSIMNNRTLVETAERGLSFAEKEQYIFIGDMSAVYSAKKNKCDLIVSDRPMFRHLLHLPFRPHFPHFASISDMIVTLDNSGMLAEIERKWFAQEGQECPNGVTEQQQISMKDFKGVFIFLIIGIAIASFVGYLECLWFRFKNNSEGEKLNSDEQQ